jgi:hypothetical protein
LLLAIHRFLSSFDSFNPPAAVSYGLRIVDFAFRLQTYNFLIDSVFIAYDIGQPAEVFAFFHKRTNRLLANIFNISAIFWRVSRFSKKNCFSSTFCHDSSHGLLFLYKFSDELNKIYKN